MSKKGRKTVARVAAAAGMALAAGASNANFIDGPEGIGDLVWEDTNRNGIQDDGEPGLEGVTVWFLEGDGTPIANQLTNANGNYMFYFDAINDFEPDQYSFKIQFILEAGYAFSPKGAGSDGTIDSNADPITGLSGIIGTCSECKDYTVDAGMYVVPVPAAVWLFGSGLLGLVGIARRKKAA